MISENNEEELLFYDDIGFVYVPLQKQAELIDFDVSKKFINKLIVQTNVLLSSCIIISNPQSCHAVTRTLKDLEKTEILEKTENTKRIIEEAFRDEFQNFSKNITPSEINIFQIKPEKSLGPTFQPFSQIKKQKELQNLKYLNEALLREVAISNKQTQELLFTLRGGFVVTTGFEIAKNLLKMGSQASKVLNETNFEKKEKSRGAKEHKITDELLEFLKKIYQLLPLVVLIRFVFPNARPKLPVPENLRTALGIEPRKVSFWKSVWQHITDFNKPTPYILIIGVLGTTLYYVKVKNPNSSLGSILHTLVNQTSAAFASTNKFIYDGFADLQKRSQELTNTNLKKNETKKGFNFWQLVKPSNEIYFQNDSDSFPF